MEKDTREEGKISCGSVLIGFLIGVVAVIIMCLWTKLYIPPQPRIDPQKVVVQKIHKEKRADHAKSSVRQEKNSREKQAEKAPPPAVIAPMQVAMTETPAPPSVWEPVIGVSGDTRKEMPRFRLVPSEGATRDVVPGNMPIVVVVRESSERNYQRQDRFNYVYGATGNNCGWGGCGNSGVYCNSYGNSGWPCSQYQNNFVQQPAPVYVPAPVIVQAPPPPLHHEHHHRHHEPSTPPHSGGPAPRVGF